MGGNWPGGYCPRGQLSGGYCSGAIVPRAIVLDPSVHIDVGDELRENVYIQKKNN